MIEFYAARIKALHSALNCQLRSDGRRSDEGNVCADRSFLSAVFVALLSLLITVKCVNGCVEALRKFHI